MPGDAYAGGRVFGEGATEQSVLAFGGGLVGGGVGYGAGAQLRPPPLPAPRAYGTAFFGRDNLDRFYSGETVSIGGPGRLFFFMPAEDAAIVKNAADAARYTGMASSAQGAYTSGGKVYGISFPTHGMPVRAPTAADAGGWPHFLEGGRTAVRLPGEQGGYLLNPTREFVVPGDDPRLLERYSSSWGTMASGLRSGSFDMPLSYQTAGCAECRYFWVASTRPAPLCVDRLHHTALYRCIACGTYWQEEERYAVPVHAAEAEAAFPGCVG